VIVVDIAFATAEVDPAGRLAAWRELVNRVFLPLAITPLPEAGRPGEFSGSVTGGDWGGLRVWRVRATPMSAVRAQRHIRSSASDDYLLALHVNGIAHAVQDDRRVTLGPGDFALFDPTRPYSITFGGAGTFEHVIYQVPRASLDVRRLARDTTALAVRAASSTGRLVSPYLQTLAQTARPGGDPPGQAFIDAGLDLAASALRAVADPPGQPDLRRRSLAGELKRYALTYLGDPELSPQAAARASYISVRQLHRLFAADGTSFTAWVREQRLRRCRNDLASQQLSHRAIAEIATRWGFRSPAHFTRAFRARYGITPAELRRTTRTPGHRSPLSSSLYNRPAEPDDLRVPADADGSGISAARVQRGHGRWSAARPSRRGVSRRRGPPRAV
jgi:AraC-like DNA-binding protein